MQILEKKINLSKQQRKKYFFVAIVLALFTTATFLAKGNMPTTDEALAIFYINHWIVIGLEKLYLSLNNSGVLAGMIFVGIGCYYYYSIPKLTLDKIVAVLSCIFSIFMVLGFSYHKYDSWDYVFGNHFQFAFALVQITGWGIFFYFTLHHLFRIVDVGCKQGVEESHIDLRKVMLVIFLCWLPYWIIFFPGSVCYDTFAELSAYTGNRKWTTHHPVVATFLLGKLMDIGLLFGSANVGAAICTGLQLIGMLFTVYMILKNILRLNIPYSMFYMIVCYFALCPVWGSYIQMMIKDTVNLVFVSLFGVIVLNLLADKEWLKKKTNCAFLIVILLGVCNFRNTGIYMLTIVGVCLVVYYIKRKFMLWKRLIGCFVLCFFVVSVFNSILLPVWGITPGSKGEMLSIPFQQTARYVKEYPEDIMEQERLAIDNLLQYDKLAEAYNPSLSDPVKGTMHSQSGEHMKEYFKAWGTMLLRHPDSYVQATMNGIYGYFYPDSISKSRGTGLKFYIQSKDVKGSSNTGEYDVHYINRNSVRAFVVFYANELWRQLPILGLCYNTGIYTWILMICIALLIKYRKYYAILGTLPSILTILFCLVSPVNGYVRYMLPAMALTPLMIAWTLYAIREPETVGYRKKVNKKKTKK